MPPPHPQAAKKPRCTRYTIYAARHQDGSVGTNRIALTGKLSRGRYRVVLQARDAVGNRSKAVTLALTVVKAKRPRR